MKENTDQKNSEYGHFSRSARDVIYDEGFMRNVNYFHQTTPS